MSISFTFGFVNKDGSIALLLSQLKAIETSIPEVENYFDMLYTD